MTRRWLNIQVTVVRISPVVDIFCLTKMFESSLLCVMYVEYMNVESNAFVCYNERTDKQFRAEHMNPPFLWRVMCLYSRVSMIDVGVFLCRSYIKVRITFSINLSGRTSSFVDASVVVGDLQTTGCMYLWFIPTPSSHACFIICRFRWPPFKGGDLGNTVVKVRRYKSEGFWFDSSWCQCNFLLT